MKHSSSFQENSVYLLNITPQLTKGSTHLRSVCHSNLTKQAESNASRYSEILCNSDLFFVYFTYCIYFEYLVFFRWRPNAPQLLANRPEHNSSGSTRKGVLDVTTKELELISASENEKPALQK